MNYQNNLYYKKYTTIYNDFFEDNPHILSIILNCDLKAIKTHFYTGYGKGLIEWIYNPQNYDKWGKNFWDLEV